MSLFRLLSSAKLRNTSAQHRASTAIFSTLNQHRHYHPPAFINTESVLRLCGNDKGADNDKDVIFVDVRAPETFANGCIEGAKNIHDIFTYLLPNSSGSDLDAMKQHFTQLLRSNNIHCGDHEHVIIYEDGLTKLYGSSCRGYFIFKYMGHPYVSVLEGGYQGILQLDESKRKQIKTVIRSAATNDSANSAGFNYNDEWMCGYQEVLDVLNGKRQAHLLDVRDEVEWNGSSSSPYGVDFTPRKGRLPGATWMEWYEFMEKDGRPKSKEEVEQMMKAKNIQKEDDIIIYCFKGSRASNTLMILNEYGYKNVSNYFASWNEWSRKMDLPIDDAKLYDNYN